MPRPATHGNSRLALRIGANEKATILRAVALKQTDMTDFVLKTVLREAESVIREAERIELTERDRRRVLQLLENPPVPTAKLMAAARTLPPVRR